jgi:TetR/AcrR family transcriptional repressor of lmrAB and yxaGH operons
MPRKSDARQKAVQAAARLFQRQGYHGTGLAQILEESGAPKGSFYHHFPGGKEELALEAIRESSRGVEALFAAAAQRTRDPAEFVRTLTRGLARWIESSDFTEGCPVAILTLETTPDSPRLQAACRESYASWQRLVARALGQGGATRRQAERLAMLIVAGFEGGLLLSMAECSTAPLRSVGAELAERVAAALGSEDGTALRG